MIVVTKDKAEKFNPDEKKASKPKKAETEKVAEKTKK